MKFAHIFWIYLLIVAIPIFIISAVLVYKKYKNLILRIFSITQISKVILPGLLKLQKITLLLYFLIFILFLFSLSGPQWGLRPQEVKTYGVDIIIAIDVSKSMLTEDVVPNRLQFAKRTIEHLLNKTETHRVGIITFAGIAFYHCPFTVDLQAAKDLVSIIDTDIVPYPGTKIGLAIEETLRVFREHKGSTKVMLLFTDGEDHDSYSKELIQQAKQDGIIIYTIGVGTPEGKPIAIRDSTGKIIDYKKDKQGNIVVSRLNEKLLYEIAEETGGRYFSSSYGETGIAEQIINEISNLKQAQLKAKVYNLYTNRYYYFVYLILLFMAIEIFVPKKILIKL
ncbi:MAG: VWA domain-containing protein [Endomicrobia bacterium]|nr:VWA domain-containing protein [Endomicrobiia bacterium]